MDWRFPALLLGAMVLSIVLSLWQHRRYLAVVNGMAKANAGLNLKLVSGRSKGRLRGAVVVLLVDPARHEVVDAKAMIGSTVFSKLQPAPELLGPLKGAAERTGDKHLAGAVEHALSMLPGARPAAKPSTTPIKIPRT